MGEVRRDPLGSDWRHVPSATAAPDVHQPGRRIRVEMSANQLQPMIPSGNRTYEQMGAIRP